MNTFLYLLAGMIVLGAVYAFALRPWFNRWGATNAELRMVLPGDEIAAQSRRTATRAITIHAPAEKVWPWLVQIGQGRGGLYSYDWLENLVGCNIHSASAILPEHQDLKVGDQIRLGPEGYPFFVVIAIDPGRALILRAGRPDDNPNNIATWVFTLQPVDGKTTRLVVRNRNAYLPTPMNTLIWRITELASFVMEQKMLGGIRVRAEGG